MRDLEHSCRTSPKYLRLEIKRHDSTLVSYKDVSVEELLLSDIKIWELECLYLEPVEFRSTNRIIGKRYYLKSDSTHYLVLLWLGDEMRDV